MLARTTNSIKNTIKYLRQFERDFRPHKTDSSIDRSMIHLMRTTGIIMVCSYTGGMITMGVTAMNKPLISNLS